MARNRVHVSAGPARVAEKLSEAAAYPRWVVGAAGFRGADEAFPASGSRFGHRVGLGPVTFADNTEVVENELPRRLVLKANGGPLGAARIEFLIEPSREGSIITMTETPADRLSTLLGSNPLADWLLGVRNAESLARLKREIEGNGGSNGSGARWASRPSDLRDLRGARVLVTGASSGIGLATAEALAREGATVAMLSRGGSGLENATARVGRTGWRPVALSADVTDREGLEAQVSAAAEELGGLDAVVANAAESTFGPFTETAADLFDETVETVLIGTANTLRASLPHLERTGGVLVVVGSVASRMPLPAMSAYSAAKHGVRGLVKTLRVELREARSPVSVCLVNPPAVDTSFDHNVASATGLLPPRPPGAMPPERVAREIVSLMRKPRAEVTLGVSGRIGVRLLERAGAIAGPVLTAVARAAQTGGDRLANREALAGPVGSGKTSPTG